MIMKLKLFIEDKRGCVNCYTNVKTVYIKRVDKKQHLIIKLYDKTLQYPLTEIVLAYLIDLGNYDEVEGYRQYFRYEK